jgi:quercetin dioxygenase-like cupin family protein
MLDCIVVETKDIEPVSYDWGAVKWVANEKLAPSCEQSFGLVHILPGKTNPEHWHTAAEEIVFMLQGECHVLLGDREIAVGPGQTLYIPQGVKHEVANRGWEPVLYVCSFSASKRGTLFGNPSAPGARPTSLPKGGDDW